MLQKIISGVIIASSVLACAFYSPFIWFLMVLLVAVLGNYELQKIIEEKKYRHSYKQPASTNVDKIDTSQCFLYMNS